MTPASSESRPQRPESGADDENGVQAVLGGLGAHAVDDLQAVSEAPTHGDIWPLPEDHDLQTEPCQAADCEAERIAALRFSFDDGWLPVCGEHAGGWGRHDPLQ